MKRQIEPELVQASAYFQEQQSGGANARNLAVQLLSLPELFATILHDRPVSVLRLLATSKQLRNVLARVQGLFIVLLDHVLVAATNEPAYAFYCWEFHQGHIRHLMRMASAGHYMDDWECRAFELVVGYGRNTVGKGSTRGDALVQSAEPAPHTTMCEVMRCNRSELDAWRAADRLDAERRLKVARVYTLWYPFRLGPFVLLDTRRLHLNRCFLAVYAATGRSVTRYMDHEADRRLIGLFLASDKVPFSDWLGLLDTQLAQYDVTEADASAAFIVKRLKEFLAGYTANNMLSDVGASVDARALLALPLPADGDFLSVASFRAQLAALYHDAAVGRRALVSELAYLEKAQGPGYVTRRFGQCVQCASETENVHVERRVFMCAQCNGK
jgi:hypothetical protein